MSVWGAGMAIPVKWTSRNTLLLPNLRRLLFPKFPARCLKLYQHCCKQCLSDQMCPLSSGMKLCKKHNNILGDIIIFYVMLQSGNGLLNIMHYLLFIICLTCSEYKGACAPYTVCPCYKLKIVVP